MGSDISGKTEAQRCGTQYQHGAVSQMVGSIGRMTGEKEFFYCTSVYIYGRMKVTKFY